MHDLTPHPGFKPQLLSQIKQRPASERGFSLVEVLVSIIILSFSLLGMAGLQTTALQSNREARLQSTASGLARELAEMMRGNNRISILTGTANPYLGTFNTVPLVAATPTYCMNVATGTTACANQTEIANAEMTEWLARVDSILPGAQVVVCQDSNPFDNTTGLPVWACSTGGTGANLVIKIGWTRTSTNRAATASEPRLDRASIPAIVYPVTASSS